MLQQPRSLYFNSHELKTYGNKTYTQIFIAALFITAKTWEQPGGPSVGECVSKL